MADDDPLLLDNRRLLDRYRVGQRIAVGGMSVVYRGTDERLGRAVSIKVYCVPDPTSVAYRAGYEHFLGEVAALSRLRHPHTLRIYDVGFLEGVGHPFQICELLDGGTLREQVKRDGPLTPAAALQLLDPVLGALDEAHACGLVHADVKPSNVLLVDVAGARMAKLADFGIARRLQAAALAADTLPDAARVRLFSPGWAAPEQIRGEPVSPATDVFGAGLLLAFAVTGRRPLPTTELTAVIHDRGDAEAFIRTMIDRLRLPAELRRVVMRACSADPRQRFRTIAQLREALAGANSSVTTAPVLAPADLETTARFVATDQHATVEVAGARLQLSWIADEELHLKGLNCFFIVEGGRLTNAVEVTRALAIELFTPARDMIGRMTCTLDARSPEGPGRAAMLDFGPDGERLVVYRKPRGDS